MLIDATDIQAACKLSIMEVRDAMQRTGYGIDRGEITGVEFKGALSTGTFVYEIFGPDPEGGDDISLGNVYLRFHRKMFSNKFELHGEY